MSELKLTITVNKGRHGAPLAKLGKITEQLDKFLREISNDCGATAKAGEWIADQFVNSSIQFNTSYPGVVDCVTADKFVTGMQILTDFDDEKEGLNGLLSKKTYSEFAKIGQLLDPSEVVHIDIHGVSGGKSKQRTISYAKSQKITSFVGRRIQSYGSFQGKFFSWHKESRQPYFVIQSKSDGHKVKIYYHLSQYSLIHQSIEKSSATILVAGICEYDGINRSLISMSLDKIKTIGMLSPREFETIFGSVPNFKEASFFEET